MQEGTFARKVVRSRVRLDAEITAESGFLLGSVLDISPFGVFFRPESGFLGGKVARLLQPEGAPELDQELVLRVEGNRVTTTVRWVGCSDEHASWGVGLEFVGLVPNEFAEPSFDVPTAS